MDFVFRRSYRGNVQAIIFDWAGTTVDFGCQAPTAALVNLFAQYTIDITVAQAREPMGLHKRDHIRAILHMAPVAHQWQARYGRTPTEADVEQLYVAMTPIQIETIGEHADLIVGTLDTVAACRASGIKIGATTGYNLAMMAALAPLAAQQGYTPDAPVCADEVVAARPAPWMALTSAARLGVYPMESIVKVGDALVDIAEGLNAGMWTIGLAQSGNELGLSQAEVAQLTPDELASRLQAIRERMYRAGAHFVVNTIADVPPILDDITARIRHGERP